MQERLREILETVYNKGYGITGKTDTGMRYVIDKHLEELISLIKEEMPKKREVDEFDGALPDPISRFNAGYNQAINEMLKKMEGEK